MGFSNPAVPWSELERRLSGRSAPPPEAPISTRRRRPDASGALPPEGPVVPYAELHCHSDFSFLDGASPPEELVAEAVRLGLTGLALTDHDGFHGAPMLAEAARAHPDLRTVYGAELSLGLDAPQLGVADPAGTHLLVLARGVEGYHRLAGAMTLAHLRGDEKGRPDHRLDELVERGRGHWVVLTGCRKGAVRQALAEGGGAAADAALGALVERFGAEHVVVELTDHAHPGDTVANDVLAGLAREHGLPVVATNNVHYARPEQRRLAQAMSAIRARRSLADLDGWLPVSGQAHLRSGEEMAARFARHPGAVAYAARLAGELAFDLRKASPRLPKQGIPEGHTPTSRLRELTWAGFARRYAGTPQEAEARSRVERELEIIERKDFPGYFVIVHDIVDFAHRRGILCQGRGSAASSAVCYALGITAIDPVRYGLPFERFISQHRDEEPDIDVDFDARRREEVIQWVYDTYGRLNAAQVANVISYRPKMAVRDAAKALGFSPGQQDAWSKQVTSWTSVVADQLADDGTGTAADTRGEARAGEAVPPAVVGLAEELLGAPRHLGIHSGGMVLTEQPIGEVCPIERARMDRRTVLQWDKDACASMGLVKFDLLGLGMLSALDHMIALAREHLDEHWELHSLPKEEPAVYDMLCRADSVGVFQVESRAQIGTLPRLRPRTFYDLAVEIALIRPGPIQGGAVHPYIRRAMGQEPIAYPHPSVIPILERTRGVPLFQEQLMQMAMVLGDCDADDADLLRRAMGSKRGIERIERIERKLYEGMARKGLHGERADAIYLQIRSFANFGFAESHALSFALLVYASSWFKLHYPAAFLAGLLRAQPMGFYSPQSLVGDARRHDVEVRRPDLLRSDAQAGLEPLVDLPPGQRPRATGLDACRHDHGGEVPPFVEGTPDPTPRHRRDGGFAVRLGLASVRGIGDDVARRIVAAREERPFRDLADLSRRAGLDAGQLEALATAGVFEGLGLDRRQALWTAGWTEREEHLEGLVVAAPPPTLPGLDGVGVLLADLWATGVTPDDHPFAHLRPGLRAAGVHAVADLVGERATVADRRRVSVAGVVTHRQRPGTAGGVTFLNLEDETGMLNVVCGQGLWRRHRAVATRSQAMVVRGLVERRDGVTNLVADRLSGLSDLHPEAAAALETRLRSRDFR
ncbi:error-prone DNA polymerase [Nocardioides sp. TRM66260-LWL]|uniref:error-prone DNA polymerase n=1 Tax=Nocardioides sp. TRM66260-LWL TaxID=2874478 RepID=UPI001CC5C073|nr:error-prone DNA polymerase [Nocardioides sp. TRM66260-LWL]MBZ5735868.1 error-prone DNA polymerase [Nocardioides sp. TRM66260-LWL]